ncbi:MAG: cell division protein ZipA [Oleispira sp.]|nr:cell division protein ZipA [Oleispira sp.]MBL4880742.1 cell division protein ZipA [Oleispira sp.]
MELNLRTILVVLGALVMLGILFDGFRRMRRARQEALSLDVKGDFKFPEQSFSSELPNGGARVVGERNAEELLEDTKNFRDQLDGLPSISALDQLEEKAADELDPAIQDSLHEERIYAGEPDFQHDSYEQKVETPVIKSPEVEASTVESPDVVELEVEDGLQAEEKVLLNDPVTPKAKPLNLDEHVPLLMDVEELGKELEPQVSREAECTDGEEIELSIEDIPSIEASVAGISEILAPQVTDEEPQLVKKAVIDDGRQEAAELMAQAAYAPVKKPGANAERLANRPDSELILVTYVIPHDEEGFCGEDILYLVNSCDLRHGEREIFYRFEQENGEGPIQFSMANSLNPGTFNPETLLHERIYGVSLFMSLPGPKKAMDAFEAMTEMASVIARNLGGDVHDETHSIMALQTIEHNRQQVRDFVRKQKLAGKK